VVSTSHPLAGQKQVSLAQLHGQSLIAALTDGEPAIAKALRDAFADFPARPDVTQAGDTQTIIGLAACGFGVGLGPQDMRTTGRADTWIFDVRPRIPLPSLTLAFRSDHQSSSLTALLSVVADTCPTARPELARFRAAKGRPEGKRSSR
jgi:DNA-binding transcriptional LysR family regulator